MNEKLKAKKEKLESDFNRLREDSDKYYSEWFKSTTAPVEEENHGSIEYDCRDDDVLK